MVNPALYWLKSAESKEDADANEIAEYMELYSQILADRGENDGNNNRKFFALLISMATTIARFAESEVNRFLGRVIPNYKISPVDLSNIIKKVAMDYYTTIKNDVSTLFNTINDIVYQNLELGIPFSKSANAAIELIDKYLSGREKLVARNYVSNTHAAIQKEVFTALGMDEYLWVTADDEKVRSTHKPLHMMVCRFSDPTVYSEDGATFIPRTGDMEIGKNPGEAVNCRCLAMLYILKFFA